MDDEVLGRIEAFLSGAMNAEERLQFENELSADPLLQQRMQVYKQVQDILTQSIQNKSHEDALKQTFENIYTEHRQKRVSIEPVRKITKWHYMAAAILFLGVALVYLFLNKIDNTKELYVQYAVFPLLSAERGGTDTIYASAADNYNAKRYKEAAKLFSQMALKDTDNLEIRIDLYLSYLQDNLLKEALKGFTEIAVYENVYTNQARWYAALTYLKLNDSDSSKKILLRIPPGADTYAKAQALLKDLK